MKKILLPLLCLAATCTAHAQTFTAMTYNIRYDTKSDAPFHWDARKEAAAVMLKKEKPSLLGLQEALMHQVQFFDSVLCDYGRVGVGRDDGKKAGEFSALYYDRTRFELLDSATFWLSATPSRPSMGWDAACKRVVSWAKLKDKKNGAILFAFNTHFDHIGKEARMNSAKLLIERIESTASGYPVIVSGDLNATIDDAPIQYLLNQGALKNSRDCADIRKGPDITYHNYGRVQGGIIDYIMVSPELKVLENKILDRLIDGMFLSDHNPVKVKLKYEK